MWSEMHVTVKMVGDACRWAHLFQEALQVYWKTFSIRWLSAWE